MNALVLGATGRIGNAVVRELLARGADVTATGRREQPPENLADLPVDYRSGDLDRPGQIEAWVEGHDVVVDAAAPYHLWLFGEASYSGSLAAVERRMEALLRCVADAGAALVFVSSFAASRAERPLLDRTRAQLLRLVHPYFELKRRMDGRVTRAMRAGLRIVVFRPTYCTGPWDLSGPDVAFIPLLVNGTLPALPAHEMNVLDVRDLAAMIGAAIAREMFGRCIPAVGHNTTMDAFAELVCRLAGVSRPRWHVSAATAAAVAYGHEVVRSGIGMRDHPALGALLLLEQAWAHAGRDQRELGVTLRPLSRSALDSLDWYARRGVLSP